MFGLGLHFFAHLVATVVEWGMKIFAFSPRIPANKVARNLKQKARQKSWSAQNFAFSKSIGPLLLYGTRVLQSLQMKVIFVLLSAIALSQACTHFPAHVDSDHPIHCPTGAEWDQCVTIVNVDGTVINKCDAPDSTYSTLTDQLGTGLLIKTYTLSHRLYDVIQYTGGEFGNELNPRVADATALQNFLTKQYESLEEEDYTSSCIINKLGLRNRVYQFMLQALKEMEAIVVSLEDYSLQHVQ